MLCLKVKASVSGLKMTTLVSNYFTKTEQRLVLFISLLVQARKLFKGLTPEPI